MSLKTRIDNTMILGIYEQIINQLFEEKISSIDRTRFYIGERLIKYVYLGRVTLSDWKYINLGTRHQMQIQWHMVEPIPGSVMHFARMREVA